jgi:hypothetical protein
MIHGSERDRVLQRMAAASVLFLAICAVAQWQVNNRVGQVNRRVGGELYGNMGTSGTVRYAAYQTNVLPSEARYATWRSGALPSEIRMNYNAVGPLAPSGAISYVPKPSPTQQAMKMPEPQLYNPAYGVPSGSGTSGQQLAAQPGFAASSSPFMAGGTGTIRYADRAPAAASSSSSSRSLSPAGPTDARVNAAVPSGYAIPSQPIGSNITLDTGPATSGALLLSRSPLNTAGSVRYSEMSESNKK